MKNNKWLYGAFTMNSDDLGIGTIYYGDGYFGVEDRENIKIFNPNTNAPYTAEEIESIVNGAAKENDKYITDAPEAAALGISANNSGKLYFYDDAAAKAILTHTDALILNEETGALSTAADNSLVAESIV